jgi:hypothetical protein
MFGKKCQPKPESIKGIRIKGLKKQLYLRSERTSGKNEEWDVAEGPAPLKRKKSLLAALA